MSVRSYCFIIDKLTDADVDAVFDIVRSEKLIVKMAVLKRLPCGLRAEIVALDEGTMKFIKTLFEKRTNRKLVYKEDC